MNPDPDPLNQIFLDPNPLKQIFQDPDPDPLSPKKSKIIHSKYKE
uniref:Uncharacterized protein n=1 Tax=Romanomermis culicivorax TaxID=13658 RepID=A0A915K9A1_ROMCU